MEQYKGNTPLEPGRDSDFQRLVRQRKQVPVNTAVILLNILVFLLFAVLVFYFLSFSSFYFPTFLSFYDFTASVFLSFTVLSSVPYEIHPKAFPDNPDTRPP